MSDLLGQEPITLLRASPGSVDSDGGYVDGPRTVVPLSASVQPLSGQDAQTAFEGERSREWYKLYCPPGTVIRGVDQHVAPDGQAADRFTINGATYEARKVKAFRASHPIPHTYVECVRVQEGGA